MPLPGEDLDRYFCPQCEGMDADFNDPDLFECYLCGNTWNPNEEEDEEE